MNCPMCGRDGASSSRGVGPWLAGGGDIGHWRQGRGFDKSVPWAGGAPTLQDGVSELSREIPLRPATLQGDVAVPVCQSVMTGFVIGVPAAMAAVALGWSWWVAPAVSAVVTCCTWLWLLGDSRGLLRMVETIVGRDSDVGDPVLVRIELSDSENKTMRFVDLPVSGDVLKSLAAAVLGGSRAFSRRGLSGVVSETDFAKLSGVFVSGGLARQKVPDKPQSGLELTGSGRAVLRHFL